MGKIVVLFDSHTGNTLKMAELVAIGAERNNSYEVKLLSVDQAKKDDIIWCDGIAVGSPTCMGILSWKMKKFWDENGKDLWGHIDGKIGCAFSSSGGWGGGAELSCMSIITILMNYGFLVFGVTNYVAEKTTLHYGAINAGYPETPAAERACTMLGEKLSKWVSLYVDKKIEV